MKTFDELHRILIAVEDSTYSDIAARYGFDLARKLGAEVGLLHVNEVPATTAYNTTDPLMNDASVMVPQMLTIQEESGKNLLNRVSEAYGQGVTTYTFNKLGSPKNEILATADEWKADMIILGTHGRTGFDHFISGSVSEKVIRKAKCPVLIIPNKEAHA